MTRPKHGGWRLDRKRLCLVLHDARCPWRYEVDLERCKTSAQMLDWIMQVAMKAWTTNEIIAGLVLALRSYLRPQATLCSFGAERGPINVREMLR